MDQENEQLRRARARVRRIKSFYSSVITFILVNILLVIINLISNPHHLWFYWVTLIWGFVLVIQAFNTFTIRDKFLGEEWEEKKVQDLMKQERRKKH